ncbi:SusC/RagA family TonB-linked outer membrane protein [Chitinophagaceae bacterium LB-8]|uniref:SusC/RagA family TonB-linked outer membrane protein n=1 Tax=Paraflavisolibacter caeni TaxID=2982496 RepID=A0A9X2Y0H0_9BACT|nr:SusC/RagA family TonB-linked outer membrane protein [Paraflavisolibacter caeni]MCU7552385.1 SusC/RagA family TonB-linked outer membrane protein [Paraflavisolibacter caeni]
MRKLLPLFILLFTALTLLSQQRTITGKVTDANGNPVAGATITVQGSTTATQTNTDGSFSILAPPGSTLVLSSVGFETQQVPVGSNQNLSISLRNQNRELSEVVVTAVGIRREAKTIGYAATTVRNEELTRGRERSVLNSLQGKVAGVQITNTSGGVGSSTRIQFRGPTSLLGNNQALIVVDGIPINNSSLESGNPADPDNQDNQSLNNQVDPGNRGNDINPEDVESVTLLKGPAAAALYGSRAANGALIITTKNGKGLKSKRAEISFSSSYSRESILKLPDLQNEYGQGGQKEVDLRENFSWGPKFDGQLRPWGQVIDGEQKVKPYIGLKDNVKEFFNIGQNYNNNVSFSQNNDRNSYFVSYNNVTQKGIMPGTEYTRNSVRLTGTADLSNKFYSNATVNYIHTSGDLSIQGQGPSPYDQVIQTPRDIPLLELKDYKNDKFNTLSGYYGAYTVNPWYLLGEDSYNTNVDRVLGSVEVGFKATQWLDILYRIGTDVSTDKRKQQISKRVIPDDNQNSGSNFPGQYQEGSYNLRELTSDLIVTFNRKLSEDISLRALAGHNVFQQNRDLQVSTVNSLVVPGLYNLSNSKDRPQVSNFTSLKRLWGLYADINFSYKNYLFLGLTARNDWSSTLPEDNRSFFYPSANASFVFSDAFEMPEWLTYGKLRASAAKVGNDANPYLLQLVYPTGSIDDGFQNSQLTFPHNGVPGYTVSNTLPNPDLTPEFTTSYEGGLEASFLKSRIGFDVTYYSNASRDQILALPYAGSTGFTARIINVGKVTNKGFELMLRGQPVRNNDFTWEVTGTFTKNKSRVVSLFEGVTQVDIGGINGASLIAKVGEPYGSFFGAGFLRDSLGRVVVDEETGFPVTEPTAQVHGNIQPKYLASLMNSFSYKGFTLTALLDGRKGGVFLSRTKFLQAFIGTDPKTLYNDREPFVVPNSVIQTPDGKFTENTDVKVENAQNYWTDFVSPTLIENMVDASFLKLREVSLSYQLPQDWVKKTPFTAIQVGLIGRNLVLWTPDENTYCDPETNSWGTGNLQGFEYGSIPSTRSYGANVRITL